MKSAPSETVTLWSTVQGRQEEAREDDSSVARSAVAGLPAAASGTPLARRVASPHDRAAIAAVIGRAVGGQDDEDFWESLGPLRARLADVGRRLGVWLAAVTPGGGG
ncbi:MAG: hypothetical protein ABSD78_08365 [Acidimicrobiales bacterium]